MFEIPTAVKKTNSKSVIQRFNDKNAGEPTFRQRVMRILILKFHINLRLWQYVSEPK